MSDLRIKEIAWELFHSPPNDMLIKGHSKRHMYAAGSEITLCGVALHDDRAYTGDSGHDDGSCVRCFRIERGIMEAKAKLAKLHDEAECLRDLIKTDAWHKPVYERGLKYIRKEIAKHSKTLLLRSNKIV